MSITSTIMKRGGAGGPEKTLRFRQAAETSFASYDIWKAVFVGIGKMRGVSWAICYQDPMNGRLTNHWVSLHQNGNIAGFNPILVMDVWEHAYLLDYKPSERVCLRPFVGEGLSRKGGEMKLLGPHHMRKWARHVRRRER